MKQTFAFVVECTPNGYGAFAPDFPASFATAATGEDALRGARDSLAAQLGLFAEMGDRLPEPRADTSPGLARANETPTGEPADPNVRFFLLEVDPNDAPPTALSSASPHESPTLPTGGPRRETFTAIFERAPRNYGAYFPDLPGCVAAADSIPETREMMRIGLAEFLQDLVDNGDPIPTKRRSAEEALADHHRERAGAGSAPEESPDFAEQITVEIQPPRPAARRLGELWRDAHRRRVEFEKRASRTAALAPGASRCDTWAAILETGPDGVSAHIPDLPGCRTKGRNEEEARNRLRYAVAEHLRREHDSDGAILLPRRSAAQALAYHYRQCVEYGLEVPDPEATVEMIPIEFTAPSIACAS